MCILLTLLASTLFLQSIAGQAAPHSFTPRGDRTSPASAPTTRAHGNRLPSLLGPTSYARPYVFSRIHVQSGKNTLCDYSKRALTHVCWCIEYTPQLALNLSGAFSMQYERQLYSIWLNGRISASLNPIHKKNTVYISLYGLYFPSLVGYFKLYRDQRVQKRTLVKRHKMLVRYNIMFMCIPLL